MTELKRQALAKIEQQHNQSELSINEETNNYPNNNQQKQFNNSQYWIPIQYTQWYNNADQVTKNASYTPQTYSQWYYSQISTYCSPQIAQQSGQYGYSNSYNNQYYDYNYSLNHQENIGLSQYGYQQQYSQYAQYEQLYAQYGKTNGTANFSLNNNPSEKLAKKKLSRNQKRKIKKQQLKKQYEQEQKKIGKWVTLQRKDLIEDMAKIEQAQRKIKQKKKQKLSHLIQIHKQVYKHMMKKNQGAAKSSNISTNTNKNNGFRIKKKSISHARKMKLLYQDIRVNGFGQLNGRIYKLKEQANDGAQDINMNIKMEQKQQKLVTKQFQAIGNHNEKEIQEKDDGFITQSESESDSKDESEQQQQYKQQKQQQNGEQSNNNNNNNKNNNNSNKLSKQAQTQTKQNPQKQVRYLNMINYHQAYNSNKLSGQLYHNMQIRQWVDHMPSAQLDDLLLKLINRLAYKQAINKINKPQKAKKLIVAGVHQSRRTLRNTLEKNKAKFVVLAINVQRNQLEKGIDDQIQQALNYAKSAKVPVMHACNRNKLGRAFTGKFGPKVTMISVINYQGYQDNVQQIMDIYQNAKNSYDKLPI